MKHIIISPHGKPACGARRNPTHAVYVGPEHAMMHGKQDVCPDCVRVVVAGLERQVAR